NPSPPLPAQPRRRSKIVSSRPGLGTAARLSLQSWRLLPAIFSLCRASGTDKDRLPKADRIGDAADRINSCADAANGDFPKGKNPTEEGLVHVDALDLVQVHFDSVAGDKAVLADQAMVGDGDDR